MPQSVQVHIIGASGRTGVALCRSLLTDAMPLVPVVRNMEKWAATGIDVAPHIADLGNPAMLHSALESATHIVCCAHAHHAGVVIEAAPVDARLIFLGSTRKFTKWLDAHGAGVLAGELAFLASGRSGVMLHPTMIYGAQGEDNVRASQHCCTVCRSHHFPAEARRWFSRSTRTMSPAQSAPRLTTRGTGRNRW